jgi:hypothetical protein
MTGKRKVKLLASSAIVSGAIALSLLGEPPAFAGSCVATKFLCEAICSSLTPAQRISQCQASSQDVQ